MIFFKQFILAWRTALWLLDKSVLNVMRWVAWYFGIMTDSKRNELQTEMTVQMDKSRVWMHPMQSQYSEFSLRLNLVYNPKKNIK